MLASAALVVPLSVSNLFYAKGTFTEYRLAVGIAVLFAGLAAVMGYFTFDRLAARRSGLGKTLALVSLGIIIVLTCFNSKLWIGQQRAKVILPLVRESEFFMKAGRDSMLVTRESSPHYYYENMDISSFSAC